MGINNELPVKCNQKFRRLGSKYKEILDKKFALLKLLKEMHELRPADLQKVKNKLERQLEELEASLNHLNSSAYPSFAYYNRQDKYYVASKNADIFSWHKGKAKIIVVADECEECIDLCKEVIEKIGVILSSQENSVSV